MSEQALIHLLVIEDNAGDFLLVQEYLKQASSGFTITRAETLTEALELLLNNQPDAVLLDLSLPDSNGLESVRTVQAKSHGAPVIVLTGFGNEQFGIDSLKMGAEDYLLKDDINSSLLIKTILYSLERSRVRIEMSKQDRLFRVIAENSLDVITLNSAEGDILYCTSSLKSVLGFDEQECIGMNEKDFVHPDDWPLLKGMIDAVLKDPDYQPSFEIRLRHKDGAYRWCEKSILNLQEDPHVQNLVCSFRDITDRKLAAEKIASSERRLSSLVQSGSDLIAILDLEGNYSYVAPTSTKVLGIPPEFFIGKNAFSFIHPDDLSRTLEEFGKMQTKRSTSVGPFRFQDSKGNWRWIETEVTNLLDDPAVGGIVANSRDITEKLLVERELRKLSLIARETINAVVITDENGVITWVNNSFTHITGYGFAEAIGRKPGQLLQGPDTDPATIKLMSDKLQAQEPFEVEAINYSKDGRKYWIQIQCQPIFNDQNQLQNFFAIETDITERKRSDELLRSSEERYRSLFDFSPASIIIWNPEDKKVLEVNSTAERDYGYSKDAFRAMTVFQFNDEKNADKIEKLAHSFVSGERVYHRGIWEQFSSRGDFMQMDYSCHIIPFNGKKAVLAHGQNVTERLQLEKLLDEERKMQQVQIADAAIMAQEREREEIGRELHDNVNQILASSRLYLGLVKKEDPDYLQFISKTDTLIKDAIAEIRNLSHTLIPSAIYESSLTDQLDTLLHTVSPITSINVAREYQLADEDDLSGKLKLSIYRIVQEQLNNILKYARASNIILRLKENRDALILQIIDDGVGFDPTEKKAGVGLINIRTRASLLNGTVLIQSAPGQGCEIKIAFPRHFVEE
jgi:PAS domain S-box-containing protein